MRLRGGMPDMPDRKVPVSDIKCILYKYIYYVYGIRDWEDLTISIIWDPGWLKSNIYILQNNLNMRYKYNYHEETCVAGLIRNLPKGPILNNIIYSCYCSPRILCVEIVARPSSLIGIWRTTWEHTPLRNPSRVTSVVDHSKSNLTWRSTWKHTRYWYWSHGQDMIAVDQVDSFQLCVWIAVLLQLYLIAKTLISSRKKAETNSGIALFVTKNSIQFTIIKNKIIFSV